MEVYLIRHGQSQNNALTPDTVDERVPDPDLTETGLQQAQLLAEYIIQADEENNGRSFRFTHVYISPMHRTLQTAKPLTDALGIRPEVWVDLHERGGVFKKNGYKDYVGFPGMNRQQISRGFPRYHLPEHITEDGWYDPVQGLENEEAVILRAERVANVLKARQDLDEKIALISHFGFIDSLIKALFHLPPMANYPAQYHHENTGITRIEFHDGTPVMIYQNRIAHLPYSLRTR